MTAAANLHEHRPRTDGAGEPVRGLRVAAHGDLERAGVASAANDVDLLLAHALGVPRASLAGVAAADPALAERFRSMVRRRAQGEPLQHIVGSAPFRYLDLAVGPGVFVPRPETELLAGWVIEHLRGLGRRGVVVDVGTGTGAVALAVATEVPGTRVLAVEADPTAAGWAERNVQRVGAAQPSSDEVMVEVVGASAAELGETALHELRGCVDVLVSNPPYVPVGSQVAPEVAHDPPMAVWGGTDGLDVMRDVVGAARRLLRDGGWLAVEHDENAAAAVSRLLPSPQWERVANHLDLAGRPRFTVARRASGAWR